MNNQSKALYWLVTSLAAAAVYGVVFLIDLSVPDFNVPDGVHAFLRVVIIGSIVTSTQRLIYVSLRDRHDATVKAVTDHMDKRVEEALARVLARQEHEDVRFDSLANQLVDNAVRIEHNYEEGYAAGLAREPMRPQLRTVNGSAQVKAGHQN